MKITGRIREQNLIVRTIILKLKMIGLITQTATNMSLCSTNTARFTTTPGTHRQIHTIIMSTHRITMMHMADTTTMDTAGIAITITTP